MDDIAKRLEALRHERGWSGREFSRRAELDEKHFEKIQKRGGAVASADTLRRLAAVATVNLHWLLTGQGPRDVPGAPGGLVRLGALPGWEDAVAEYLRVCKATPTAWVLPYAADVEVRYAPAVADLDLVWRTVEYVKEMPPPPEGDLPETRKAKGEITADKLQRDLRDRQRRERPPPKPAQVKGGRGDR